MRNVAFSFASALRSSKLHSCGSCSAERDHVIRRVLQTRSRAVTTSARSSQAAAAANPSGYFSQNSELLSRKKYEDIEDSWRRAQLTSDGKLPCESAQEHLKRIAIERDARLANAALSFDDLLAGSALPSGLGHRDIIMRTTTLDTQGEVLKRSELVAKSQLCTNHGLQPRDLRKVDSRVPNGIPTILVRKEAILLNILHVRLLIKANTVILFDAIGTTDSELLQQFLRDLQVGLKAGYRGSGGLPYEFRAIEVALSSVARALEEEMAVHREQVDKLLGPLESHIVPGELRKLLHYSRQLQSFQKRARGVQAAIDEILEQDDDLSAMYLSENAVRARGREDHQEVEMLLESFSKEVEEIVSEVDSMVTNLHQTQDVIELILDTSRNSLLTLDLQASIATMGLASGAFIAGLFGMNLHSSLEMAPYAFWSTSLFAAGLVAFVTIGGLRKVRKLRRIGLASGAFGDLSAVHSNTHGYSKKALYYEKSQRRLRDRQERSYAKQMQRKTGGRALNYDSLP